MASEPGNVRICIRKTAKKFACNGTGIKMNYHLTCHAQQNSTQGHPTSSFSFPQELKHVIWRKCSKDMRIPPEYIIYTNGTNAEKPHQNYGSKQEPNLVGAIMLKGKQADQYDACNRNFYICKITKSSRGKTKRAARLLE